MKTKPRAPWLILPGQQIAIYTYPDAPPHAVTVTRRTKHRSQFTGATVWRFFYRHPYDPARENWITAHGLRRSHIAGIPDWQAEKIEIPA